MFRCVVDLKPVPQNGSNFGLALNEQKCDHHERSRRHLKVS